MPQLDLKFVRAQFPAFALPQNAEQCFFENAGGSFACRQVIDRLNRFYTERKVQPYAPYGPSTLGGQEMDEAFARLAALLGAAPTDISIGPSTTQNVYVLAQAFGQMLAAGDAIIVTNQDHEANSGAWRSLAARGVEVREWQVDPQSGLLNVADLQNLLDDRVKLVCFPHCSNVVGAINPVVDICAIVRAAGAYSCVDGVSYAPHGLPNLPQLGADIYMFSAYKTYGPHQGVFYVNPALADRLPNQGHGFNSHILNKKFTPAGPDHAQTAACAGIVDYFEELHDHHFDSSRDLAAKGAAVHDLMRGHEMALTQPILDYLKGENSVRLLGPSDAKTRAPTIAIDINGSAEEAAAKLAKHGIWAGSGDFYAVRPLQAMGVDLGQGVLRLSFVHYTSQADIDQLLEGLEHIL